MLALAQRDAQPLGVALIDLDHFVAAVHQVERAGLEGQPVQHVHVVQLAVADVDEKQGRC